MANQQEQADRNPTTGTRPSDERRNGRAERPVLESVKEYGRGLVGGLLFSLPTLYTCLLYTSRCV